mgnify:CR=1 FL=1
MREPISSICRAICHALGMLALMMALPPASSAQSELADRQVPFLTLRNETGADDPGDVFGDERSDLKAGHCRVRELDFQGLSSLADVAPAFIREEFLRVDEVVLSDVGSIYDELEGTATTAPAIVTTTRSD